MSSPESENDLPEVSNEAEQAAIQRATKKPSGIKMLMHSKNRPALLVMGGGLALVGGVLLYVHFSGSSAAQQGVNVAAGNAPSVKFQAGGQANPAYTGVYNDQQRKSQEEALQNGRSAAPGFVDQQKTPSILGGAAPAAATKSAPPAPPPTKTVIIETVAPASSAAVQQDSAMRKYQLTEMKALMGNWNTAGPITVEYAPPAIASSSPPAAASRGTSASGNPSASSGESSAATSNPPVIGAGNLYYSVADTSMDSDQPGPVLATMENGPLKGAHLLGKFANTNNRLIIEFQTATMPNNATIAIDAVAVDPKTNRTALATSVNHHYLERYGLLIGGAFLQGFGQAIMTSGQTTVSGAGGVSSSISPRSIEQNAEASLGQVGQTVGQIGTQDYNSIQPTVRVAMGTGMGILFLKPVKASTMANALAGESQQIASTPTKTTTTMAIPSKTPVPKLSPPQSLQQQAPAYPAS